MFFPEFKCKTEPRNPVVLNNSKHTSFVFQPLELNAKSCRILALFEYVVTW